MSVSTEIPESANIPIEVDNKEDLISALKANQVALKELRNQLREIIEDDLRTEFIAVLPERVEEKIESRLDDLRSEIEEELTDTFEDNLEDLINDELDLLGLDEDEN
jgi:hypothetical protein